ncbi:MAG: peptide chain release factor N(5)-glutamine methyltransferase [Acidobacteriota bacterium]|nr:peptide chain release factor N(5)-glutamine methyltransferase [Acidobacteriota bacterium]
MPSSIAEAILQGAHDLRKAGVPEARREAGSLLAHVIGRDQTFILSHADDPISEEQLEKFRRTLEWRGTGKPLQYITGHQEFFGLDFEVTSDVLIPRPETELLVEKALKSVSKAEAAPLICDVGTGSGCIAISLLYELRRLHNRPHARAVAIDISEAALAVAKRNASRHSVTESISFVVSDCLAALDHRDQGNQGNPHRELFDLIVSNPPYVTNGAMSGLQREVRDFEPRLALEAGVDGLSIISRLVGEAGAFLKTGGHFLFEMGFDQGAAVEQLIDRRVWKLLDINNDLQGIPRIVVLEKVA